MYVVIRVLFMIFEVQAFIILIMCNTNKTEIKWIYYIIGDINFGI